MNKENTALVIVDMQKGFLDEGAPIFTPNAKSILPNLINLIKTCREREIQIFWSKSHIELFANGPYRKLFPNHFNEEGAPLFSKSSEYYEIIDELKPHVLNEDIVIFKDRYSVFHNSNFDTHLKQLGIKNLLVCGVTTNVCVESTIRDAFTKDYFPYLISDCTATFSEEYQKIAEEVISFCFGFVTSSQQLKGTLN